MKYILTAITLMVATPVLADGFEGEIPENVCWYNNIAYGLGSHNLSVSVQFRGAVEANINHGYGQFCVLKSGEPTWVYMDYDHVNERWVVSNMPLAIE